MPKQVIKVERNWLTEFGTEYEVPKEITDKYEDQSWHNDSSPSFLIMQENPVQTTTNEDGSVNVLQQEKPFYYMSLWVEEVKECRRELPVARFEIVMHGDCDGFGLGASEEFDEEFKTRLRIVETYAKAHGLAHIVEHGMEEATPICSCGNISMASQGKEIICDVCHKYCGEIPF